MGAEFCELIGIARECKGWTLRELEKRTGISNALISQIETGHVKDPGFSTVVKLADALGLKLDRLAEPTRNQVASEFALKVLRWNDSDSNSAVAPKEKS